MKTFRQYILESLLDDEDELASNDRPLIEDFLKKNYKLYGSYNIREEDGEYFVDVDGDVEIKNYHIDQLTSPMFSFGVVTGGFNCEESDIKTLEGAPRKCDEFICGGCEKLESLVGGPQEVSHGMFVNECIRLKTLEGAPRKCGGIVCIDCRALKTLKGAPLECTTFNCCSCDSLKDLVGAPRKCYKFDCSNCDSLKDLTGAPWMCEIFNCSNCDNLISLKGAPKKVDRFECYGCRSLTDTKDEPKICGKFAVDYK